MDSTPLSAVALHRILQRLLTDVPLHHQASRDCRQEVQPSQPLGPPNNHTLILNTMYRETCRVQACGMPSDQSAAMMQQSRCSWCLNHAESSSCPTGAASNRWTSTWTKAQTETGRHKQIWAWAWAWAETERQTQGQRHRYTDRLGITDTAAVSTDCPPAVYSRAMDQDA